MVLAGQGNQSKGDVLFQGIMLFSQVAMWGAPPSSVLHWLQAKLDPSTLQFQPATESVTVYSCNLQPVSQKHDPSQLSQTHIHITHHSSKLPLKNRRNFL